MKKEILFDEDGYSIERFPGIPVEAIKFLDDIAWGNEGALYEHRNTEEHIKLLNNPVFVGLYKEGKIKATGIFSVAPVSVNGQKFNCNYFRYFAASKDIRGKGIIKKMTIKVMELIRENQNSKTIFFACVEKENKSSYNVCESAGYIPVGTVNTLGFSRFFPRFNPAIQQVQSQEGKREIISLLSALYSQHALVQFNSLFINDNYFVIKDKGEIVAGCQYHRAHWVINNMKGFSGQVVMRLVPLIPVLNQIFNPKRFEFLAFEGIYVKPGHEHVLPLLFEGLLAREGLKSSIFWMGSTCPVRHKIIQSGNLGMIHSFIKDSDVEVMAAFKDMDSKEIANVKSQPIFASAFDYI